MDNQFQRINVTVIDTFQSDIKHRVMSVISFEISQRVGEKAQIKLLSASDKVEE